jgi:hypothetical protein
MASATKKNNTNKLNNNDNNNNNNNNAKKHASKKASKKAKINVTRYLSRGTNLKFKRTDSGWNVLGKNTYNWKDNVKALGAKWNNKTWRLPKNAKLGPLRKVLATLKKAKLEKEKENKKKPVSLSKHLEKGVNIFFNKTADGRWSISGPSAYDWKEEIKELGGRWNGPTREWLLSADKSVAPLRKMVSELKRHRLVKEYAEKLAAFDPPWKCCDKMIVRSFTSGYCSIHCPDGHITDKGRCYTGD